MRQHSRRLAWTSATIHGLVHASVLMLPPLLGDLTRTYRVSLLEVLAAANAMYLVYGLAAIPAGYLADRFGSRRMLIASAGGCALALLLTAAAPNFAVLATGLVCLGTFAGVYHPSGLSLLSRGIAPGEQGRAIGLHGAGGSLGEALAPAWAAFFATAFDWRVGFVAAAALSFACALLAASLPAEARGRANDPHGQAGAGSGPDLRGSLRALATTLVGFWNNRPLRWLLGSLLAAGFVYRGLLTFLALHIAGEGAGGAAASYVMSAVLVVGIVAQRFGGELTDRVSRAASPRAGRAREWLLLVEVALVAPLLFLLASTRGAAAIAAALVFGFVWAVAQPLANALTAAYTRPSCHGLLYGIQFAATFAVGSFATTLGGFLFARGGTRLVFLALGGVGLLQLGAVATVLAAAANRGRLPGGPPSRRDKGRDPRDDAAGPSAASPVSEIG